MSQYKRDTIDVCWFGNSPCRSVVVRVALDGFSSFHHPGAYAWATRHCHITGWLWVDWSSPSLFPAWPRSKYRLICFWTSVSISLGVNQRFSFSDGIFAELDDLPPMSDVEQCAMLCTPPSQGWFRVTPGLPLSFFNQLIRSTHWSIVNSSSKRIYDCTIYGCESIMRKMIKGRVSKCSGLVNKMNIVLVSIEYKKLDYEMGGWLPRLPLFYLVPSS